MITAAAKKLSHPKHTRKYIAMMREIIECV